MLEKPAEVSACVLRSQLLRLPNPVLRGDIKADDTGQFTPPAGIVLAWNRFLSADEDAKNVVGQSDETGEGQVRFLLPLHVVATDGTQARMPELLAHFGQLMN